MTVYQKFAEICDQMRQDQHSRNMVLYLGDVLKRFDHDPIDALDLCCGTGTAVKKMIEMGIKTDGLDQSLVMLKVARKKLTKMSSRLYR